MACSQFARFYLVPFHLWLRVIILKGELKKLKKNLLTNFLRGNIWPENFLFYHKTCFFENLSFIYSVITLFSKIAYYK